ncbi:MAG: LpxD N-terminal domain-containing protein, partial [Planctomycetales bacterium]
MGVTVGDLARQVGGTVRGDASCPIMGAQALRKAGPGDISFAADEKNLVLLKATDASAVIVPAAAEGRLTQVEPHLILLFVADPFDAFLTILAQFRPLETPATVGLSPQATIHPSATFGENCHVFPGAYI